MKIQNVNVEIRVNGRPVRTYNSEGKVFIESREGSEYTIRIENYNWFRILAVPSIDGISVMDGKKAGYDSGGYIIGAYQTYEIKGFRKDFDTVGNFKFTKKGKGYAESKGEDKNVGIISVAIFQEKQIIYQTYNYVDSGYNYPHYYNYNTCNNIQNMSNTFDDVIKSYNSQTVGKSMGLSNTAYCCSLTNSVKPTEDTFDHSTTWGSKTQDKVVSGTFERETLLAQFDLYYASKDGLKTLGIDVVPKREVAFPQGFGSFAEPPKGW